MESEMLRRIGGLWKESKSEKENKTYTSVTSLDYDGKVKELARIIGGIEATQLSLDTAAEMIENAKKY